VTTLPSGSGEPSTGAQGTLPSGLGRAVHGAQGTLPSGPRASLPRGTGRTGVRTHGTALRTQRDSNRKRYQKSCHKLQCSHLGQDSENGSAGIRRFKPGTESASWMIMPARGFRRQCMDALSILSEDATVYCKHAERSRQLCGARKEIPPHGHACQDDRVCRAERRKAEAGEDDVVRRLRRFPAGFF
jgi:hypothetical protein